MCIFDTYFKIETFLNLGVYIYIRILYVFISLFIRKTTGALIALKPVVYFSNLEDRAYKFTNFFLCSPDTLRGLLHR